MAASLPDDPRDDSSPRLGTVAGPATEDPVLLRLPPAPLRGGPRTLLRFLRAREMLSPSYLAMYARLAYWKLRLGRRLQLDGIAFIRAGAQLTIGRDATLRLGRWSWIGQGTKVRVHEGICEIGARTVLGEECTISSYQRISIGRECIIADRSMFIDFDHGVTEVERPIRDQGFYKRDVVIGHNVWAGYGAAFLRGARVGDNTVVGTYAVVTRGLPANVIAAGQPARVVRQRQPPRRMRWG